MPAKPIPDGYTTVAPYLIIDGAKAAIEFYKRAFGAADHGLIATPDGKVAHAELKIGDTVIRLCDNLPIFEGKAPRELGGTTVELFLYVEDVDAAVRKAEEPAQPSRRHRRRSSGANVWAASETRSAISGCWPRGWRT